MTTHRLSNGTSVTLANDWGVVMPGDTLTFTRTVKRKWWQFWKPRYHTVTEQHVVMPQHWNCRCAIKRIDE